MGLFKKPTPWYATEQFKGNLVAGLIGTAVTVPLTWAFHRLDQWCDRRWPDPNKPKPDAPIRVRVVRVRKKKRK